MREATPFISAGEIDFHVRVPVTETDKDGQRVCETTVHFLLSYRLPDIIQPG